MHDGAWFMDNAILHSVTSAYAYDPDHPAQPI